MSDPMDSLYALLDKHEVPHPHIPSDIPPGWLPLVDRLLAKLQSTAKLNQEWKPAQIKEKFGGLRFYAYGLREEQLALVSEAEAESYNTCQECGAPGALDDSQFWVLTLCPDHTKQRAEAYARGSRWVP